jgi:hypothetical protein
LYIYFLLRRVRLGTLEEAVEAEVLGG